MARSKEDLLGPDPDSVQEHDTAPESGQAAESDWARLRNGVSAAWIAGAIKRDPKTVKKRLAGCKPKKREKGVDLYDLEEAMSYVVKPRFDVGEYIKTMNPQELPVMLRKEYWEAENKRAKFMRDAGELWHTDDVLAVFAEAFKRIKTTMQVWPDDVERVAGLNRDQYNALIRLTDGLREELHKTLVEMPTERRTEPLAAEVGLDEDGD